MRLDLNNDKCTQGGQTFRSVAYTAIITSADLTAAGVGPESVDVGLVTLDNFIPRSVRARLADAFDNGAGVSLSMEIGITGEADRFVSAFDCFTLSPLEGAGWESGTIAGQPALGYPMPNTQLVATFTAGADQLANFSDGSVTVEVWGWELDDAT